MFLQLISNLSVLCCIGQLASGLNQGVRELGSASSAFSQRLYQEIGVNQPNAIFSPFSAHACLSMTYMGARGNTAQEMRNALQVTGGSSLHQAYRDIIDSFNSVSAVDLLVGNAVYMNPNALINEDFKNDVENYYHAKAEKFDLDAPSGPEAAINSWVAQQTRNKITDLLKPDFITDSTAMLLINTLFFNGSWHHPFTTHMTSQKSFYKSDGSETQVDLMHQTESFRLNTQAIPGVDVISLPFRDSRFSLIIALPNSHDGLSSLESHLSSASGNIDALLRNSELTYVDLFLPKFKLTATIDLKNALQNMGMRRAFLNGADFSGITSFPVKISDVIQKATIEVTEHGTVAAAATAVHGVAYSAFWPANEPFVFKADHPFLYFLRDGLSGEILFQGKLQDPDIEEFEV